MKQLLAVLFAATFAAASLSAVAQDKPEKAETKPMQSDKKAGDKKAAKAKTKTKAKAKAKAKPKAEDGK